MGGESKTARAMTIKRSESPTGYILYSLLCFANMICHVFFFLLQAS
jgi:hypothetical protein